MKLYVTSGSCGSITNPSLYDAIIHCGNLTNFGFKSHKSFKTLSYMQTIASKTPFYWVPGDLDYGFDNLPPLYGYNIHKQLYRLDNFILLGIGYDKGFKFYESLPYADIIVSYYPAKSLDLYQYIVREQPEYVFCGNIQQNNVFSTTIGRTKIFYVANFLIINI